MWKNLQTQYSKPVWNVDKKNGTHQKLYGRRKCVYHMSDELAYLQENIKVS
jgi:hypothetical protein